MKVSKSLILSVGILLALIVASCDTVSYPYGERIFKNKCADCHMDTGEGLSSLYPSLSDGAILSEYRAMPCIIRHGVDDTTSVIQMLGMPEVSDVEITNVMNYIIKDLNNSDSTVLLIEVQEILNNCPSAKS